MSEEVKNSVIVKIYGDSRYIHIPFGDKIDLEPDVVKFLHGRDPGIVTYEEMAHHFKQYLALTESCRASSAGWLVHRERITIFADGTGFRITTYKECSKDRAGVQVASYPGVAPAEIIEEDY